MGGFFITFRTEKSLLGAECHGVIRHCSMPTSVVKPSGLSLINPSSLLRDIYVLG